MSALFFSPPPQFTRVLVVKPYLAGAGERRIQARIRIPAPPCDRAAAAAVPRHPEPGIARFPAVVPEHRVRGPLLRDAGGYCRRFMEGVVAALCSRYGGEL